jgi:quercetin 2,3-dioxygenase
VNLYVALLNTGEEITHVMAQNRHAWLQVARGKVFVNGHEMAHGDGLAVSKEERLSVSSDGPAELLLFDLA